MPDITRVSLPAEFYDITSSVLLKQPEPQYLYGMMFKAALSASLNVPSMLGFMGREVGGNGAPYSPEDAYRLMLAQPIMADTIQAKVNFSGLPGHTMRFNRPVFANTTYTQASRQVGSNTPISTTTINVGSEQVSLTLFRFAGPYDQTNARIAPYGIDALDATLGVHNLASIVGTQLKRDMDRFLDGVQVTLLDAAAAASGNNIVYPQGMAADNDAAAVGAFPLTYEQINRAEQLMDDNNLPTYSDGFRLLVLSPTAIKQLKDDPQYAKYSQYFPQFNPLFPGYIGSVGKFHVFKSTTLSSVNNASGVAIKYGHAICPGVLLGGMGRAPSVRYASDDNYGESQKLIWLGDFAFGTADNRFVYGVRSSA